MFLCQDRWRTMACFSLLLVSSPSWTMACPRFFVFLGVSPLFCLLGVGGRDFQSLAKAQVIPDATLGLGSSVVECGLIDGLESDRIESGAIWADKICCSTAFLSSMWRILGKRICQSCGAYQYSESSDGKYSEPKHLQDPWVLDQPSHWHQRPGTVSEWRII